MSDRAAWLLATAFIRGCNALARAILWSKRTNLASPSSKDELPEPKEATR